MVGVLVGGVIGFLITMILEAIVMYFLFLREK